MVPKTGQISRQIRRSLGACGKNSMKNVGREHFRVVGMRGGLLVRLVLNFVSVYCCNLIAICYIKMSSKDMVLRNPWVISAYE